MRRRGLMTLGALVLVAAPASAWGVLDVTLVSRSDAGANPPGAVAPGAVSGDGSRIVFASPDPLTGIPSVPGRQLYVRDTGSGRTLLASSSREAVAAGAPVDLRASGAPAAAISLDGRFVVFSSSAANLTPEDTDGGARDVFRKDLLTGAVRLVSTTAAGGSTADAVEGLPDMSGDGARVVFSTGVAADVWADSTGSQPDLVVRDLLRGGVTLASVGVDGAPLVGPFGPPSISADGWTVAFTSGGTVMVRDLRAAVTRVVGPGTAPDLSGDGRTVVYAGAGAVMISDTLVPAPRALAAVGADPLISADGMRAAFTSSVDLTPDDTNGQTDVYVRDVAAASPERVSRRPSAPVQVNRASDMPTLAPAGGAVAFRLDDGPLSSASLAVDDVDLAPDALVATLPPTDVAGPLIQAQPVPETAAAAADVAGTVTDPSGIAALVVGGARARVGADGRFAVNLNLAAGSNPVAVRAIDGAGNASTAQVVVVRTRVDRAPATAAPRATALRVIVQRLPKRRSRTLVRFTLAAPATRVWVRLARRTPRVGRPPAYLPVSGPRRVVATVGVQTALLSAKPFPLGIYQVRVTVVSPLGARVTTLRYVVRRAAPAPSRR